MRFSSVSTWLRLNGITSPTRNGARAVGAWVTERDGRRDGRSLDASARARARAHLRIYRYTVYTVQSIAYPYMLECTGCANQIEMYIYVLVGSYERVYVRS
eukprot:COSAG02_NODE_13007_length_1461_cov_1.774596_1_plen_101_part_10